MIGVNAFLDALPEPASEIKLHMIQSWPRNLQDAVAHATEVDAMMEVENKRAATRRGDVRVVGVAEEESPGRSEEAEE